MHNLSETLKELRLNAGLTQIELSTKLGLGQSTIVGYERAISEPTIHNLTLYAKFFDVTTDYLLGITDDFGVKKTAPAPVQKSEDYSNEEKDLIERYRKLSPDLKEILQGILKTWEGDSIKANKNV